jgi:hypothetical protein
MKGKFKLSYFEKYIITVDFPFISTETKKFKVATMENSWIPLSSTGYSMQKPQFSGICL